MEVDGAISATVKTGGKTRQYFYIEFSHPIGSFQTWKSGMFSKDSKQAGDAVGIVTDQPLAAGMTIEARVGISYISVEQAKRNLEREIPEWNFEQVKANAHKVWNEALGNIDTVGGTERQRTIFYTALYRSLQRMTDITEDGRYFSGFDHTVHNADGHDFYIDDGLWDTYRSLHPLQMLLNSHQQEDMIRSYIRMYEQSGWMPSFPSVAGEQAVMIGHHASSFILDAYLKGHADFDVEKAYEAMRKNATEATLLPWRRGPLTSLDHTYFDKGFFPALAYGEKETAPEVTAERRQAVSVTLENSYDDWCVAQLAAALGKKDDAAYFTKLAKNYANLFNPEIGFFAPKSSDGKWVEGFDPKLGGGQGGRQYTTEVNSWLYTFGVQHDVAGLIRLMGGRTAFNAKLDQLFVEQYGTSKYWFGGALCTGQRAQLPRTLPLRFLWAALEDTAPGEATDGCLVWRRPAGNSRRRRWRGHIVLVCVECDRILSSLPGQSGLRDRKSHFSADIDSLGKRQSFQRHCTTCLRTKQVHSVCATQRKAAEQSVVQPCGHRKWRNAGAENGRSSKRILGSGSGRCAAFDGQVKRCQNAS
jgi:predicted alpha-1,2-mannosidase